MSRQQRPASRRAGPVFGVLLVVLGTVGALTPAVPTARAEDVTPPPSAEPIPTPTPEPTQAPDPTPVPEPTPEPTQAPDPTPPVEPSVEPSPPAEPEPSGSPLPSFEPEPSVEPSPSAEPSPSVEPSPSPSAEPGGPGVAHAWIESPDDRGRVTAPGRLDTALADAQRFTVYRVRFQLVNDGEIDVTVQPAL